MDSGCVSTTTAPAGPVLADTKVDCTGYPLSLTLGGDDRVHVAYSLSAEGGRFLTFAATGSATIETGPTRVERVQVLAGSDGGPHLVGAGTDGTIHFYTPDATSWVPEPVPITYPVGLPVFVVRNARSGSDGATHFLYSPSGCTGTPLRLATRSGTGIWSDVEAPSSLGLSPFVIVDSRGRVHVISQQQSPRGLFDWRPGSEPRRLADPPEAYSYPSAAAVGDGDLAAIILGREIHLVSPDGAGGYVDRPIPGTAIWDPATDRGVSSTPALTATSDGALWLAYRFDDTDGTARWSDLVLVRAPAAPTGAPTEIWRRRLDRSASNWVAIESRGSRLTLATDWQTDQSGRSHSFIGVVALDATKL